MTTRTKASIYIHFPFCVKKCLYCSFISFDDRLFQVDEYVNLLLREMRLFRGDVDDSFSVETLYFGGGTPSLMDARQAGKVIESAAGLFDLEPDAEITIEANPGTLTEDKLAGYRSCGINRLSLGVQSFDDSMLKSLGRVHSAAQAVDSFRAARERGLENIGIDLINSLPGQTKAMWEDDLHSAVALGPEHISVYGLTIEEGTPLAAIEKCGALPLPDEEESVSMFESSERILRQSGYEHYEISNYALPGRRSRHNQVYWQRGNYLGFGCGAHSFLREPEFGVRWRNPDNIEEYMRSVRDGRPCREEKQRIGRREAMAEKLFLGLRMLDGVDLEQFREEFGAGFDEIYYEKCLALFESGMLETFGGRLRIPERAMLVSNRIFEKFL
ncbi:MAG TPA: radical SAM family heme chaperone HemW [Geobacteraceae bacterium]|nr:radical SAM family heme chaperone HemW [Geobacteraceae bacterium]